MALGETSRLNKPLPGGRQDATVVLHPLKSADILSPTELMAMTGGRLKALRSMRSNRDDWIKLPVPAFLIEHPSVGPVLVDTGFHGSVATDPKQNLGQLARMYSIEMEPEQAVAAQLRGLGVEPRDVKVVVMTHMHMDHASAISDFTEATYVLGQREWEAFSASRSMFQGYVKQHAAIAVDFQEIVYDRPAIDSYSTFGRSFDLFGDGSVRLVYTPGHTRGHQSVIVRLKQREALLTGDAVYFLDTLDHERRGFFLDDEHTWRRSMQEVQLYRRENPDALIIPSHDGELWSRLEPRYE